MINSVSISPSVMRRHRRTHGNVHISSRRVILSIIPKEKRSVRKIDVVNIKDCEIVEGP